MPEEFFFALTILAFVGPLALWGIWDSWLKHRAKLDDNSQLARFAETLEKVIIDTVESGHMTKDLALLVGPDQGWLTTTGFLDKIDENLQKAMS